MAGILLLYETFDGQSGLVASALRTYLAVLGHDVTLRRLSGDAAPQIDRHDAVILGGAVRYGRVAPALEKFVAAHRDALARRPGALFTVSLCAGGPGAKPAEARRYIDEFLKRTAWVPRSTAAFAGALRYTRYGFFRRLMMRFIVGRAGGETDTSRDYEYTDWDAVRDFASSFSRSLHDERAPRGIPGDGLRPRAVV